MATITKIHKDGLGNCAIHFSIETGKFDIRLPEEVKENFKGSYQYCTKMESWNDVKKELENMKTAYLHEILMTRKVIIIQLQTSVSNWMVKEKKWMSKEYEDVLTDDNMSDGQGFKIKWYIAEEYQFAHNTLKYKFIECFGNARNYDKSGRVDILPQMLMGGGEHRVITYRADLHIWLKNLDKQIEEFLNRMITFFDFDTEKFLANFEQSKFKLLGS